jgi:hypothetical protein
MWMFYLGGLFHLEDLFIVCWAMGQITAVERGSTGISASFMVRVQGLEPKERKKKRRQETETAKQNELRPCFRL